MNILYTQDTSHEVAFPCSLAPSFPRAFPPPARFLPPAVHASPRPFIACSHHQPSLPQPSIPPLTLRACVASLLPLSLPLLSPSLLPPLVPYPTITLLPPSLHRSLPPSLPPPLLLFPLLHPPSLPPCLPSPCVLHPAVQSNVHRVCVFVTLHCIV